MTAATAATWTLVVDPGVHTLLDFHFRARVKADNGKGGAGSDRDGANGGDLQSARTRRHGRDTPSTAR